MDTAPFAQDVAKKNYRALLRTSSARPSAIQRGKALTPLTQGPQGYHANAGYAESSLPLLQASQSCQAEPHQRTCYVSRGQNPPKSKLDMGRH